MNTSDTTKRFTRVVLLWLAVAGAGLLGALHAGSARAQCEWTGKIGVAGS